MWLRVSLVFISFSVVAQTSFPGKTGETMRDRYGPPVSESFLVRPGIVVSVSYSKKGQACELFIRPQEPASLVKSAGQTAKSIDSKLLTEVIDELVPVGERGRHIFDTFLNMRCLPTDDCAGTGSTWEKISIYRNGGSNEEHYATIQFLDKDCGFKNDKR